MIRWQIIQILQTFRVVSATPVLVASHQRRDEEHVAMEHGQDVRCDDLGGGRPARLVELRLILHAGRVLHDLGADHVENAEDLVDVAGVADAVGGSEDGGEAAARGGDHSVDVRAAGVLGEDGEDRRDDAVSLDNAHDETCRSANGASGGSCCCCCAIREKEIRC